MGLTKANKVLFNVAGFAHCVAPRGLYSVDRVLGALSAEELRRAEERAEYYCRRPLGSETAVTVNADFRLPRRKPRHAGYFFPLRRLLNYFPAGVRFNYQFGDVYGDTERPTLIKARPLGSVNSTLLPLNAVRHFRFVDHDPLGWDAKRPEIVSRNEVHRAERVVFMATWFGHERTDLGQVNVEGGRPDLWLRPRMSVDEQLAYKFIACIEGNDVATNLKWVMSSNSLPVMPAPTMESWFMEGTLRPGENYVDVRADYADLLDRMDYYLSRPAEAREILEANHRYVASFRNPRVELATALLTLRRYFGQKG